MHPLVPLEPVEEGAWTFTVDAATANPVGSLYGGAPLAAAVLTTESVVGAPARWATTRFLRGGQVGDVITVTVRVEVSGRRTTHATVTGRTADHVVFDALVVAGAGRPDGAAGQWAARPDVPGPEGAATIEVPAVLRSSAVGRIERRPVKGGFPLEGEQVADGHIAVWMRIPGVAGHDRATLAWLADCVPLAVSGATGSLPGGTSLDNTVRFAGSSPTDWVLVDIHAEGASDGYGYGSVHLWAEDGTLLATGSQTALIRPGLLQL